MRTFDVRSSQWTSVHVIYIGRTDSADLRVNVKNLRATSRIF